MTPVVLRLSADDDVAIAVEDVPEGAAAGDIVALDNIPRGHKVALRDVAAGALVHKYGHVIGVATTAIGAGQHVHTHNLGMPDGASELASGGGSGETTRSPRTSRGRSTASSVPVAPSPPATTSACSRR